MDASSIATINGNTVTLHLTDGGPWDADGVANGTIVDPLVPVRELAASVVVPSKGATLSGSTYLDVSAPNATAVKFLLFGGSFGFNAPVLCTATLTLYGWVWRRRL